MKRLRTGGEVLPEIASHNYWCGPSRFLRDHYVLEDKIASGSFGIVYRGRRISDNMVVAIKAFIKHSALETSGFQLGTLREISAAMRIDHPSFVRAVEVCVDPATRPLTAFLVLDYAEHELGTLLRQNKKFTLSEKKCLIIQLLSAVRYLSEELRIAHRDIKPGNLLYTNSGYLKICDFGSSRQLNCQLQSGVTESSAPLTDHIGTLWYESPESLLEMENDLDLPTGCMDMWSTGCVIHEILNDDFRNGPLFGLCRTKGEVITHILNHCDVSSDWPELLERESKILAASGYSRQWSGFNLLDRSGHSALVKNFLLGILQINPQKRLSAKDALRHPFLTEHRPLPQKIAFMPSFEETNQRRARR